jgi:hypothetical protein
MQDGQPLCCDLHVVTAQQIGIVNGRRHLPTAL